jgi:hypothetical protein
MPISANRPIAPPTAAPAMAPVDMDEGVVSAAAVGSEVDAFWVNTLGREEVAEAVLALISGIEEAALVL